MTIGLLLEKKMLGKLMNIKKMVNMNNNDDEYIIKKTYVFKKKSK